MIFDRSFPALRAAAALGLAVLLGASMLCGCEPTISELDTDEPDDSTVQETTPFEEDTRDFTDLATYKNKIDTAFAGATPLDAAELEYTVENGAVTVTGYTGDALVVVLPDTVDGAPVTAIEAEAFAGSSVRALSLPNTVTRIGKGAFKNCKELATLRSPLCSGGIEADSDYFGYLFGANNYELNAGAVPFSLETVILTAPLASIPDHAFYNCNDIVTLALPDTLESIGAFAFMSCSDLAYVSMSDSLKTIGNYAFIDNTSLLSLTLPDTVTEMGLGMLQGCGAMESLTLPFVGGSPTEDAYLGYLFGAKSYTFTEGFLPSALIEVTLLDGCVAIPDNAFCFASRLRRVNLPSSCTTIGRRAFYECDRLAEMDLTHVSSVGDGAFMGCTALTAVTLGENLSSLGLQAFYDCASLTDITLPDALTAIPASCFDGCTALSKVTWGSGLTTIGQNAFRRCDSLMGPDRVPTLDGITVEDGNAAIKPAENN